MKIIISNIFLLAAFSSCISLNSTGFYSLSKEEQQHVKRCNTPIKNLTADKNTYMVNAGQVKEHLKDIKHAVVYSYLSFCHSENCVSPSKAEQICKSKGYNLILISGTYENLSLVHGNAIPTLAIDPEAYGTDNYQKLNKLFYNELTGTNEKERDFGSFYVFENGTFIKTYENLNDIPSI
ncbi:hypothetical protein [Xylanibacter caecicola]|uniref:hypothetical protein n=1 Tax=Xylanibacter caecicola TaxID=2736294 RepID=UPI00258BE2C6|nr:hypothetical protein [Xylanibacter caecicola]